MEIGRWDIILGFSSEGTEVGCLDGSRKADIVQVYWVGLLCSRFAAGYLVRALEWELELQRTLRPLIAPWMVVYDMKSVYWLLSEQSGTYAELDLYLDENGLVEIIGRCPLSA